MPARRRTLALLSGALASTAGCLADTGGRRGTLEHGERERATGDPARTTKQVTDPSLEYVPSNESVRYPAKQSGGEVVDYGTTSFERFAVIEAATAGAQYVSTAFDPPLYDREGVGVSKPGDVPDLRLLVRHVTRPRDPWETGTIDPELGTTRLVADLPKTLAVTVEFADRSQTTRFPVFVKRANYVEHTASE
jgi:hypothetical protein